MLKLQYFGYLIGRANSKEKTLMLGKIEGSRRRGWQDEMVGWLHRLNGHEFQQTLGDSEGQGSLARCGPWGPKESDTTEQLNHNNKGTAVKEKTSNRRKKKANTQNQKLRGLNTTEIYFLTVLETRSPKLQCLWGACSWRFWRRSWFKTLPTSVGADPWCSLVIAAEIQGLPLSSCVSLCARPPSFLRTQVPGLKAHPKSCITSVSRVPFTGTVG